MDSRHQTNKNSRKQGQIAVGSLPLLDDVNELIEKEKILLEFKVLEQQKEAFEWKAKYDHLLGKVAENASSSGNDSDYRVLEAITEDISAVDNVRINSNLIDYIHKLGDHYILDMSGQSAEFVASQIAAGSHILKQYATLLQAVYLRGCCLTDENAHMLCAKFVSNSAISGIDFSFNELGPVFGTLLADSLPKRKKSPEFILLQGNMPLAASPVSLVSLLASLSDRTWGLGLTLQDFRPLAYGFPETETAKKVNRNVKVGVDDMTGSMHHPMHCHAFLKALKKHLSQELGPSSPTDRAQEKKGKKSSKSSVAPFVRAVRSDALQLITSLALTHAHLSRSTVLLLEDILVQSLGSLTDLDLSFSYSSRTGAEVLRNVLNRSDCQLVRLSIAGNALGDSGAEVLRSGLENTRTLSFLDARSNNLSWRGLSSLVGGICSGRGVISVLDIRGNSDVTGGDVLCGERSLRESGLRCNLKWHTASSSSSLPSSSSSLVATASRASSSSSIPDSVSLSAASLLECGTGYGGEEGVQTAVSSVYSDRGEKVLYTIPRKISVSFTADGRVLLFSIEVHHLLSQYSSHGGQTLGFNWYLRLSEAHHQTGTSDSSAGEGREKRRGESRRRDVSRAEADTQSPGSLSYEIRALSVGPRGGGGGGDVLCSAGPVLPPCAGYIAPHAWVRCSGVVPHSVVPLKGRIEVWVLSRGGRVRAIEANQLQVTNITHTATPFRKDFGFRYYLASNSNLTDQSVSERLPETNAAVSSGAVEVHQVGGDHSGWTNNLNQACSLLGITGGALSANPTSLATQVPKGFSIVRRVVCSDAGEPSGRKHTLYFHARLSFYSTSRYSQGGDAQSEKAKSSRTSEVRGNQGYEWRVLVARGRGCSAEGRAEVVTEGSCPFQPADEPTHLHLGPWVWSGVCAELGPLHSGDEILLITRVVLFNQSGVKDKDMTSSCSVEVANCEIVSTLADQNEGSGSGSMGEFGEGRREGGREWERAKTGSSFPSSGAVLGTIPRVPHTAHFASFNDQSLALPIC